jgi:aminoglycoside/choline kinase family phosphotransferase
MEWFEPQVRATVERLLGCPAEAVEIRMLAAHASSRTYWRVTLRPQDRPRTLVLMVLNPEDRGIKSDEIVEIEAGLDELPYVNVQRYLRTFTDAVPEIYLNDAEHGLVYLEDLGDTLFDSVVAGIADEGRHAWYGRALELLVLLQTEGTRRLDDSCIASKAAFTPSLLLWEFEHFMEYGLGTKLGVEIDRREAAALREVFARVAQALATAPRVFAHRDFQSKNLLVQGERLRLIDFQDALRGPRTYDLVALLRDSYVELSPALVDRLIDDYLDRIRAAGARFDREEFRADFARMTLQRKLKDYGRFVYIHRVKGNPSFLKYNPTNARYILDAAVRMPEFREVAALLERRLGSEARR